MSMSKKTIIKAILIGGISVCVILLVKWQVADKLLAVKAEKTELENKNKELNSTVGRQNQKIADQNSEIEKQSEVVRKYQNAVIVIGGTPYDSAYICEAARSLELMCDSTEEGMVFGSSDAPRSHRQQEIQQQANKGSSRSGGGGNQGGAKLNGNTDGGNQNNRSHSQTTDYNYNDNRYYGDLQVQVTVNCESRTTVSKSSTTPTGGVGGGKDPKDPCGCSDQNKKKNNLGQIVVCDTITKCKTFYQGFTRRVCVERDKTCK